MEFVKNKRGKKILILNDALNIFLVYKLKINGTPMVPKQCLVETLEHIFEYIFVELRVLSFEG